MIIGTHNSATSSQLVQWLRPFAWLLHLTSRCQDRTVKEQLEDGVRLFNLQVCRYRGEWYISHGLCIYNKKLFDVLDELSTFPVFDRIVVLLYLDKNFWVGQDEEEFTKLVGDIKKTYCSPNFILHTAWIEGTNKYQHKTEHQLSIEEHYWTKTWAYRAVRSWIDRLPLPRYHANKYNKCYRTACKAKYLMLDFYELE